MTIAEAESKIGEHAPDFTLISQHGQEVSLSSYQGKKNAILFFIRAASCWQCRQHVEQLARMYSQLQAMDSEVLALIYADHKQAQDYAAALQVPFPILADPDYAIYERYGLNKVFLLNTRTASVVIDKKGQITYLKSATNPFTWLKEAQEILEQIKKIAGAKR